MLTPFSVATRLIQVLIGCAVASVAHAQLSTAPPQVTSTLTNLPGRSMPGAPTFVDFGLLPDLTAADTFSTSLVAPASLPTGVAVGRTPGSFGISSGGTAIYSVPLWTPKGIAGLAPALSLVYSSNSGDGVYGVGWSLAGLSSISRCVRRYAQDGIAGGVELSTADRFCIDGNRLRLFGTGTYGADGTTYQTEVADFSLIISHGVAGTGPSWFEVRRKDGLIYEYGNTTDSLILVTPTTSARTWALNKIRDRFGNSIAFAYVNDTTNGVFRPNTITYVTSPATTATANET